MDEHLEKRHIEVVDGEKREYSGEDKELYFHLRWKWDYIKGEWYRVLE